MRSCLPAFRSARSMKDRHVSQCRPSRHYLFEGNYTGGCEVPRHGSAGQWLLLFQMEHRRLLPSSKPFQSHVALRRTALMHCRNNNYGSPRNVFFFPLIPPLNDGTDRRLMILTAERLGRGAYEPPRPGTLRTTDETVSTVAASSWPDDAHLGWCVSRRHDCGLHNLYKPAAGADGFDNGKTALAFLLNGIRSEPR